MRNINTNAWFCKELVYRNDNSISGYNGILSGVYGELTGSGRLKISMNIICSIFAIEASSPDKNTFDFNKKYEMCFRLTSESSSLSKDLKIIELPVAPIEYYNKKRTMELTRVIALKDFIVPSGQDRYVFKILIREVAEHGSDENLWIVQSVHRFSVYSPT